MKNKRLVTKLDKLATEIEEAAQECADAVFGTRPKCSVCKFQTKCAKAMREAISILKGLNGK